MNSCVQFSLIINEFFVSTFVIHPIVYFVSDDFEGEDGKGLEGMDKRSIGMHQWFAKRLVGRKRADPSLLNEPRSILGARKRKAEHVIELVNSFSRTASVPEHAAGVCINDNLARVFFKGKRRLKLLECLDSETGVELIAGDHTREAMVTYNVDHPDNTLCAKQVFKLYVAENNRLTRRMLRMYGNLDNFKAGCQLKRDWLSIIEMMHRHLTEESEELTEWKQMQLDRDFQAQIEAADLHNVAEKPVRVIAKRQEVSTASLAEMKADWSHTTGTPFQTLGTLYQLAKRTGEMWDLIWAICNAEGVANPKKFKKPTSAAPFNTMGGLSEAQQCIFLRKVKNCEWSMARFRRECTIFKKKEELKQAIIDTAS